MAAPTVYKTISSAAKPAVTSEEKTKIKTMVTKDPSKPGAIAKDERGNLTLDTKTKGTVDRGIKPGDNVTVKNT